MKRIMLPSPPLDVITTDTLGDSVDGVYVAISPDGDCYKLQQHRPTRLWWWFRMDSATKYWSSSRFCRPHSAIRRLLVEEYDVYQFADVLEMCEKLPEILEARKPA